jgi:hypothetical protein
MIFNRRCNISTDNLTVLLMAVYVHKIADPEGPLYLSLRTFQQAKHSINRQLFVFATEGSKHLYTKNCAFRKAW